MSAKGPRTRIPTARPWCGYYAASPTDGSPTYWFTDDALRMRPWPPDTRYAPMLPPYDAANKAERRGDLADFYEGEYFPWLRRVADAIAADLDGTAARFAARFGVVVFPGARAAAVSRLTAESERARIRYEAITAASRVRAGRSIANVAKHLSVSWETAKRRAVAGEKLLADDPGSAREFVVEYLRRALDDDDAQRLASALLDGAQFETSQVAARLAKTEAGPVTQPQPDGASAWAHALSSFLAGGAR